MKKDDSRITIKEFGFWEWFFYQEENNLLFKLVVTTTISAIAAYIATIIVINGKIGSKPCSNESNNYRTNYTEN